MCGMGPKQVGDGERMRNQADRAWKAKTGLRLKNPGGKDSKGGEKECLPLGGHNKTKKLGVGGNVS